MSIEQNVCRLCTKAFENEKSKSIDDTIRVKIHELLRIKVPFGFFKNNNNKKVSF